MEVNRKRKNAVSLSKQPQFVSVRLAPPAVCALVLGKVCLLGSIVQQAPARGRFYPGQKICRRPHDGDRTVLSVCFVCVPHWLFSVMAVCGLHKHLHHVMSVVGETGLASVSTPPSWLRRHSTPDSCFETLTAFLRFCCESFRVCPAVEFGKAVMACPLVCIGLRPHLHRSGWSADHLGAVFSPSVHANKNVHHSPVHDLIHHSVFGAWTHHARQKGL